MITKFAVNNFRGIRSSQPARLWPITIIVGPNNSGKSTLLESLAMFCGGPNTLRWCLLRRGGWAGLRSVHDFLPETAMFRGETEGGEATLAVSIPKVPDVKSTAEARTHKSIGDRKFVVMEWERTGAFAYKCRSFVTKKAAMAVTYLDLLSEHAPPALAHIDARPVSESDINNALGNISRLGMDAHNRFLSLVQKWNKDAQDIRAVRNGEEWVPTVNLTGRSVPLAHFGDGMKRVFVMAAALTTCQTACIEEPEAFQNPGVFPAISEMIWEAQSRGMQLFISTHSVEFVRTLADKCPTNIMARREELIGVITTSLGADGALGVVEYPGAHGPFFPRVIAEAIDARPVD